MYKNKMKIIKMIINSHYKKNLFECNEPNKIEERSTQVELENRKNRKQKWSFEKWKQMKNNNGILEVFVVKTLKKEKNHLLWWNKKIFKSWKKVS